MAGHTPSPLFLFHFFLLGFALTSSRAQPPAAATVSVGLIIDAGSLVGKIASSTVPMALDDFYAAFPNSSARVRILQHDSRGDVVAAASAALQLMTREGARAILGPQSSVESAFVADLATRAEVPVVSFSATSPSLSRTKARFFARAVLSDAEQATAIAELANYFGWRRVVPIYQDDDYGAAFVPFLVDALTGAHTEVPYRCALPAEASRDAVEAALYHLESRQTRAFVVHTRPALAELVFAAAAEAGMMVEGYAWVITDGLTGLLNSIEPLQGVIGLAPYVPYTPRLRDIKRRWAHKFMRDHPNSELAHAEMGCYAVWAYDAAWAVASAAERLSPGDLSTPGLVGSTSGPTDLSTLGKSSSGEKFLEAITNTTFEGLGGRFQIVDGELAVQAAFRVVNILGHGKERGIGFWTGQHGLTRNLVHGANEKAGLAPVIWPGESAVVPRGWVQQTSSRKLRVAVPGNVDPGYRPIVHIDVDPETNRTAAGGFVIEVFEAAVRLLPYALPFEYVRVESMPYDKLVQEVGNRLFDAAVADITITADRSNDVDFTLPYMASGISMVVPLRDRRSSNRTWDFLKPFRYDLWLVSFFFFVLTGFAVWAVEHRVNDEFRGPPYNQIGTLLYFGFSTLVFAHREDLRSNLSRIAVVVWIFVVLILQSSYTASLTSMLTVPQIEPTIGNYDALWRATAEKVGIMNNSFMPGSMTRSGFPQARLVPYGSMQSFHGALLNGTIGAIVDETPYLKIFLKTYCDNFTMVGKQNKTGGFGFAFPKGSPYVMDLSRAILNLTESEKMDMIERKWFGDADDCAAQGGGPFTSDSLSFDSFWGLFLITGATSLLCCAFHLATFVAANRRPIRELASHLSWKCRLRRFVKLFDDKDLSAHTFRTKDRDSVASRNDAGVSSGMTYNEAGCPICVESSVEKASPATGDIDLAAGGQAEQELARNPDGSGENGRDQ